MWVAIESPPKLWKEELKRVWREMRGAKLSPGRAAAAVALGLFVGSQPWLTGLHTPIVLTVCILMQLDAVWAWIASNISNPFFAPFLWSAEVQAGGYLHTGQLIPFDFEVAKETGFSGFFMYLFTGSLSVGLALALASAVVVFVLVAVKQRFRPAVARAPYVLPDNAPAWWRAVERVAARYQPLEELSTPAERTRFNYVRIKLMIDPVTKMIADAVGEAEGVMGELLDIGTGRGQMPVVMLELGRADKAHGIDWDEDKIAAANEAVHIEPELDASFAVGDATSAELPEADTVLLIDVIHYMTIDEQDALVDRAARAVRPGGRLIVREADTERGWRSWMTLAEELVFTTLRFNRGARVKFRPAREIVERLEEAGMTCVVRPAWGKTPFSNVMIIGERPQ